MQLETTNDFILLEPKLQIDILWLADPKGLLCLSVSSKYYKLTLERYIENIKYHPLTEHKHKDILTSNEWSILIERQADNKITVTEQNLLRFIKKVDESILEYANKIAITDSKILYRFISSKDIQHKPPKLQQLITIDIVIIYRVLKSRYNNFELPNSRDRAINDTKELLTVIFETELLPVMMLYLFINCSIMGLSLSRHKYPALFDNDTYNLIRRLNKFSYGMLFTRDFDDDLSDYNIETYQKLCKIMLNFLNEKIDTFE